MAGTLTISTLSDGTNSTSSTNCIKGSAVAWVNFNGISGASIRSSYNLSSVTYNGTGNYTLNFTSALPNANYCVVGTATINGTYNTPYVLVLGEYKSGSTTYGNKTTSALQIATTDNLSATLYDSFSCNVAIHAG